MKENTFVRRYGLIVLAGVVVGVAALILTTAGKIGRASCRERVWYLV